MLSVPETQSSHCRVTRQVVILNVIMRIINRIHNVQNVVGLIVMCFKSILCTFDFHDLIKDEKIIDIVALNVSLLAHN